MSGIAETVEQAVRCHQRGDIEQAEQLYRRVLGSEPGNPLALHSLGMIAYQVGQYDRAADLIRKAIAGNPQAAQFHNTLGIVLEALGRYEEALGAYGRAVSLKGDYSEAYHNMALVFQSQGKYEEAVERCERALALKSDYAQAYNTQGYCLEKLGRIEQAIDSYRQAIHFKADYAEAHNHLGVLLQERGCSIEAAEHYGRALQIDPDYAEVYNNLGIALKALGRLDEAVENYSKAIELEPDFAEAYCNLAVVLTELGRFEEAEANCRRAISLMSDYIEAYNRLGIALHRQGRYSEASDTYKSAIELEPNDYRFYNNLGLSLKTEGHLEEALANYERALELEPELAEAYYNLANCLREQGRYSEAVKNYKKAIEQRPDFFGAKWNLSHVLLLLGRFEEGWKECDWWRCKGDGITNPHFSQTPRWDGSTFEGRRLFVHYERGFGDNIHFVRYLPVVKGRGGTVIFEANKKLYGLLEGFEGIDELVEASSDGRPAVEFDLHTPLLGLPGIFGTTIETIPAEVPYIRPKPEKAAYWREMVSSGSFNVGIVWAGDPYHGNDRNRSCGLERFISLAQIPGVKLYGLQTGSAAGGEKELAPELSMTNFGERFEDFSDTAGLIDNLDLVISVDTAALHLAGAMGKCVWGLLPFVPDWRWMLERQDSPWYPTMRLFRQKKAGDWEEVFRRVERELRKLVGGGRSDAAASLHSEGVTAYQQGRYDKAFALVNKAIASNPEAAEFYNTLGIILEARGRNDEAIAAYEQAVSLKSDYTQAYHNMAIALESQGRYAEGLEKCSQALSLRCDYAEAYNTRGFCFEKLGCTEQAIDSYRQAVHFKADYAEAYNHLGVLLNDRGHSAEAVDCYHRALEIEPHYDEVYNNLGVALKALERWDEAIKNYRKAIELEPDFAEAYYNLANVLRDQGKCGEAINNYKYATKLNPDYAEAHWNMALAFLLNGQFVEGWQRYKWRCNADLKLITDLHTYGRPRWEGCNFEGKRLFVHYEQGLGDNIQFARYLPMVKERGGTVIFETLGLLIGLFEDFPGVDELLVYSPEGKRDVDFDIYASLLDMPMIFGTTAETVPADVPYIRADKGKLEYWRGKLAGEGFKVGIVWAGSTTHGHDHYRSSRLEHFRPLSEIEGVRLFGLQKDKAAREMDELAGVMEVVNISREFEDFTDTAAAVANLDLVISVDTSVLHLAGAMGRPVWALLAFMPEWRWMLERQDSPWYPTMRLFRQRQLRQWDEMFERVAEELRILVGKKKLEN